MATTGKYLSKHTGTEVDEAVDSLANLQQNIEDSIANLSDTLAENIKDSLVFNDTRKTTTTVGGIAKGTDVNGKTYQELFKAMFYPYVAFSISSFTLRPSNGGVFEKGGTSILLTGATIGLSLGSETITSIQILDGNTLIAEATSNITASTVISFSYALATTTNKSLTVKVTDGTSTLTKTSTAFSFVDPYFYGTMEAGAALSSALVTSGNKLVQAKGAKTLTFSMSNNVAFIAYPSTYGLLTSIKDQNNFTVTSSFNQLMISVTVTSGTYTYYVYVLNTANTATNFKYTFNY